MLQALLPQVAECQGRVEVWVLDNASDDETADVLREAASLGPFQVKRQSRNVGSTRNIVNGPTELATGEYSWVLGDHNLLRPGALRTVVQRLSEALECEVFYANFRCAAYPSQWPESVNAGHDGPYIYIGNTAVSDGHVEHWHNLIQPQSALCTQNYVHIVKTTIWRKFWRDREFGADYTSALTTYPHTVMIVNELFDAPAIVIADAMITIFNGAQSWSNPRTRLKVFFVGLPGLIDLFQQRRLDSRKLLQLRTVFCRVETERVIHEAIQSLGLKSACGVLISESCCQRGPFLLVQKMILQQCFLSIFGNGLRLGIHLRHPRFWYICNCRPARWLKKIIRSQVD
jgi:glycosyltransferase involved in cell wall biosynthesis